jgi:hypothetical protein
MMIIINNNMAERVTVRGLNPGGGKRFSQLPLPDQSWGPPSIQYHGFWGSFSGLKRPERGVKRPPPSGAKVKNG